MTCGERVARAGGSGRRDRRAALLGYDIATATWALVFGARYLVQNHLYQSDETGWLAFTRIAMGWPLAAVALGISIWAARRADRLAPTPDSVPTGEDSVGEPAAGEKSPG